MKKTNALAFTNETVNKTDRWRIKQDRRLNAKIEKRHSRIAPVF